MGSKYNTIQYNTTSASVSSTEYSLISSANFAVPHVVNFVPVSASSSCIGSTH